MDRSQPPSKGCSGPAHAGQRDGVRRSVIGAPRDIDVRRRPADLRVPDVAHRRRFARLLLHEGRHVADRPGHTLIGAPGGSAHHRRLPRRRGRRTRWCTGPPCEAVTSWPPACTAHGVVADHDSLDEGLVDVAEAIRVPALEPGEDLLHERAAVRTTLQVGEHGAVAIVVRLEQLADTSLRERPRRAERSRARSRRGTRPPPTRGTSRGAGRPAGEAALLRRWTCRWFSDEHAHVPRESLDPDGRARLGSHQVEEFVGIVEGALGLERLRRSELVGDVEQRPLEVGRQLTGVASRGASADPISFDEHHAQRRRSEGEEGRGDAGDAGADDGQIGARCAVERPRRPVRVKLGDPGRAARQVGIPGHAPCRHELLHRPSADPRRPSKLPDGRATVPPSGQAFRVVTAMGVAKAASGEIDRMPTRL